jgi:hypothetical protein
MSCSITLLILIALVIQLATAVVEPIQRVHLIFSNHLDIGFHSNLPDTPGTDANVLSRYFRDYFPSAIAVAEQMRQRGGPERYRYLTHSFLVSLYVNDCPEKLGIYCPTPEEIAAFKTAVEKGDIVYHAYPHNLQTEFISGPELLKYAVQLAHDLDRQFNLPLKRVISQRDVPGLSRAAIPSLTQAGVAAISVGVNSGSAPPDVPKPNKPFIWKDEASGASLIGFWHPGGYSGSAASGDPLDGPDNCIFLPGFSEVLCAAWRTDNAGPHSVDEILDIYRRTRENFPQAEVIASTYDDFLGALENFLADKDSHSGLPVVTEEMGDTWIYGVASDPARVAEFRALLRLRQKVASAFGFLDDGSNSNNNKNNEATAAVEKAFHKFSRLLLKIPEHTWGVDTKEYPGDYTRWSNTDLQTALESNVSEFKIAVESWQRQRAYTQWAVEALLEGTSTSSGSNSESGSKIKVLVEEYYKEMEHLKSLPKKMFPGGDGGEGGGGGAGGPRCRSFWQGSKSSKSSRGTSTSDELVFESKAWKVGLDPSTGAISELIYLGSNKIKNKNKMKGGGEGHLSGLNNNLSLNPLHSHTPTSWASPDSLLAQIMYSTYDEYDYDAIWSHYAYRTAPLPDWFYRDFGKPNSTVLGGAKRRDVFPTLHTVWECDSTSTASVSDSSGGFHIVAQSSFEDENLLLDAGAPASVFLEITSPAGSTDLFIDVILENKTATRLPEATWFSFQPAVPAVDSTSWTMSKLNQKISPLEVMRNGSRSMHAVDENGISVVSACGRAVLNIRSLDAALVSPGKPTPFPIVDAAPDLSQGMHFNLHNNVWGTNYVMWWPYQTGEGTIRFRFVVTVEEGGGGSGGALSIF